MTRPIRELWLALSGEFERVRIRRVLQLAKRLPAGPERRALEAQGQQLTRSYLDRRGR